MLANFHTHTKRCNHAAGEDREYVIAAIKAGLTALGFSDHSPQCFDGGFYSNFRMKPEEQRDYIESISALREEFRDYIHLYIGYETEYYPDICPRSAGSAQAAPETRRRNSLRSLRRKPKPPPGNPQCLRSDPLLVQRRQPSVRFLLCRPPRPVSPASPAARSRTVIQPEEQRIKASAQLCSRRCGNPV